MHSRDATFLILSLLAIALCAGLGFWQLERLDWKRSIIARMTERLAAPPVPVEVAERRARAGEDIEFLRASATGRFLVGREAYLFTSRDGAIGWQVVAPFVTGGGTTLLVDRGFVPEKSKNPLVRPAARDEEPVVLTGVVRTHGDGPGFFAAEDRPTEGIFFSWSPAAMARSLGLEATPAFILHAEPGPDAPRWPQARLPDPRSIPNNHLQYAVTWFGLAAVFAVMTMLLLPRRANASPGRADT